VHGLDGPAAFDKALCQVVQKFRVSGLFAHHAAVVRRPDQPFSEMPLPDAIDEHASCEGMVRASQPFRQLQPAASFRHRGLRLSSQDRRRLLWRRLAEIVLAAVQEHSPIDGDTIAHPVRHRRLRRESCFQALPGEVACHLVVQTVEFPVALSVQGD
jgi:hypothetical protein